MRRCRPSRPHSLSRSRRRLLPVVAQICALTLAASCGSADVEAAGTQASDDRASTTGELSLDFPTPAEARTSRSEDPHRHRAPDPRPTGEPNQEPTDTKTLGAQIERTIANALDRGTEESKNRLDPSKVSVSVVARVVETGEVLIDRLGTTPLTPASNMKILTCASALLALGADAQFETRFEAHGPIQDGTLRGDLVVRAGGDPLHRRDGDGSIDPWIDPLIRDLRAAGIEAIEGQLVLDEGRFLEPGPAPAWPSENQYWRYYCALSGGFNVNGGCFRATVSTDGPGGAARVVLRPKYHGLVRKGEVKASGEQNKLRIGANSAGVTVGGTIPAGADQIVEEFSHPDPVQLFGESIVGHLREHDIDVVGWDRRRVSDTGRDVHVMSSSLASTLDAILLDSNNAVADQVFFLMGHKLGEGGTRQASAEVARKTLGAHGVNLQGLVQVDGSGLSKADKVTARTFVDALNAVMADGDVGPLFMAALPHSGNTGGLKRRMRNTAADGRVRAKTGWVSGASSLSGVVQDEAGEPRLTFSIIVSYPRVGGLNTSVWKPMQDEICARFAEWIDARTPVLQTGR